MKNTALLWVALLLLISSAFYLRAQVALPYLVPAGGATGQVMTKSSGTDRDMGWADGAAMLPAVLYTTGQGLTSAQKTAALANMGVFTGSSSAPSASIANALINLVGGNVSLMKAPSGYFQVTLTNGATIYIPYTTAP